MLGLGLSIPMVAFRRMGTGEAAWFDNMPGLDFTVGRTSVNNLINPSTLPTSAAAITRSNTVNRIDINTEGTTLADYDCRGWNVRFLANNCTVSQCLFNDANIIFGSVVSGTTLTGNIVEDCTFTGTKTEVDLPTVLWFRGGSCTARRNLIQHANADAITTAGGLVENNYIYGMGYNSGAHSDAIYVSNTSAAVTIQLNTVDMLGAGDQPEPDPGDGVNNTVRVTDEAGTCVLGVTVYRNILLYGANSTQVFTNCENVIINDNRLADYLFLPIHESRPASLVWTNNVNHNTGVAIPLP